MHFLDFFIVLAGWQGASYKALQYFGGEKVSENASQIPVAGVESLPGEFSFRVGSIPTTGDIKN